MTLTLYNSYSRKKEPLRTLEPGRVRMYNCGPTVYGRAHVGNLRSFLFADVLRRWLEVRGYQVRQVMNLTDVGHLLDEDGGDAASDRVEVAARRENLDPWAICQRYIDLFLSDTRELGMLPAHANPRASDHIPEMLAIVEDLLAKGHAYEVAGPEGHEVYFDVSTFPRYGELSGNRVSELEAGARIAVRGEKRHPADFALWKADKKHLMKWPSRFGPDGFPGWHIECSAMARAHLGDQLDIHTGGEDNVFPHHECEIAQSECHTGHTFARIWMHARFLQVDGGKMSKSLGNVYTLDDVKARGFDARTLRFALIRGHYRQPLNFTFGILEESAKALEGLDDLARRMRLGACGEAAAADPAAGASALDEACARFDEAMDDDLNTPRALAALFDLRAALLERSFGRATAARGLEFLGRVNAALGILRLREEDLGAEVEAAIEARKAARARRDFAAADRIRDELLARGILLEDTPGGTLWRRRH